MISRVAMRIPSKYLRNFWSGKIDEEGDELYVVRNRVALVLILRAAFPNGNANVAVMAYNCPTVSQAVVQANCQIIYVDVDDHMHIDMDSLKQVQADAIIVSHLFGIKNEVQTIRQMHPSALIIDDCAHGYGLTDLDGDYAVYSICRGKFPYCGEGGILRVNKIYAEKNRKITALIRRQYQTMVSPAKRDEAKLFVSVLIRNIMFHPIIYGLTAKYKFIKWKIKVIIRHIDNDPTADSKLIIPSNDCIIMQRMGNATKQIYDSMLPDINKMIDRQHRNYARLRLQLLSLPIVKDVFTGENAFMCVVRTSNPKELVDWLRTKGLESSTHFKPCIAQNRFFGYVNGSCPMAERMTRELICIPTYANEKYYEF